MNTPVSGMHPKEYTRIFGAGPYVIEPDEILVDIGSGYSNLSGLVPAGHLIQIDPAYKGLSAEELFPTDGSYSRVPIALGEDDPYAKKVLREIAGLVPDRVTIANALRYIPNDTRANALLTCLSLAKDSIFQIYPFATADANAVTQEASKFGFDVVTHQPAMRRLRQALFTVATINNTVTIEQKTSRVTPSDRKHMAQLLAKHTMRLGGQ